MKKTLTYISLFSSAGVGCYGFKLNGFECIATNEILKKRMLIQFHNNKCKYESGYIVGDISKVEIKEKLFAELQLWSDKHKTSKPDVIIATPPCQGMSVANHKKKNEKNRNSLVVESITLTKEILPKFFIFENVRAFLTTTCTDTDGVDKSILQAIESNLSGNYNILSKVINFKEYGSNSSRTRTLVIGVRKDLKNLTPYDIFPTRKKAKTLSQLIGDLPELQNMGDISDDIFHSFREYDKRMLPWIENLKEGQSAFENTDKLRIPHKIINGEIVLNQSKNGDKYARWYWDKEGPCVHTRNDILSSQNTVHPRDNRVFSIRELSRMMSIPENFQWSNVNVYDLNKLSFVEKKHFLKKEELNIRQCLGEAVPTGVFESIAKKIKFVSDYFAINSVKISNIVNKYDLSNTNKLIDFIDCNYTVYSLYDLLLIAEHANSDRQNTAAYFTGKDIAYSVVKDLPNLKKKKKIKILEPAVGIGNFLPLLFDKYYDKEEVIIDVCDIDMNSLRIFKLILSKINIPDNVKINVNNIDFLFWTTHNKYDIVVGNPPYKKLTKHKELLARYKFGLYNADTNNLFSFFIEKSVRLGDYVSFIVPKSLLNAPEFNKTRELMNKHNIEKICDFGEKAFKGVKIETVSFLMNTIGKNKSDDIIIESYIDNTYSVKSKKYIFSDNYPGWLIYRNTKFDVIANSMEFGVFHSFRDRQITKSMIMPFGETRVLKARNIGNNEIVDLENYDRYIDSYKDFAVAKYINEECIVMIPNLTYYPRAAFLPKDTITDGSVALLTLKNGSRKPTTKDLDFFSSETFKYFYRIARNFGTRSLNIDKNSVYFFGILKEQ